jgi:PPE-repeat protein
LPPEINSALLFDGPGAEPMLAAAAAWDGLAEHLSSSASSFVSVTSDLAKGAWQGASATAMMSVASQYASWLNAAAAQAEATSSQAAAMADAFETAQSATVQPAVVAANRGLLQVLAATNYLGQNAPTIMDIESAYDQMWASDVAAMSDYHADASEAVAHLAPWQHVLHDLGFHFNNGQLTIGSSATPNLGLSGLDPTGHTLSSFGELASGDGMLNQPVLQTGLANHLSIDAGMLDPGHDVTGGFWTANFSSGLLNSGAPGTGFNVGLPNVDLLHPATHLGGLALSAGEPVLPD